MLRILIFLAVVLVLGLAFAWIADNPGLVTIALPNQGIESIEISLMLAVVVLVTIIAGIMIVWSMALTIWRSPLLFSNWRRGRRRDRGYNALSKGMIAVAAGDATNARKLTRESNRFLPDEPLVLLLDAQTSLLEENRGNAQLKFEAMLENPDTRLLGLRGLYVEAERQGEVAIAAHYAERAAELAPDAAWSSSALLRHQSTSGDWAGALKTLETSRWTNKLNRSENNRLKAVLQTAMAMDQEDQAPDQARTLALSAHKLAPSLVPAAIIAARISSRLGDFRKASKVLETTWKVAPHPEIADAYVHVRSGDAVVDRQKRARYLAGKQRNNAEGNFAIAIAAIDAKDWREARSALAGILKDNPSERICLLMADIEQAEHGDHGRVRDWLSRAVRAPRDAVWTADGYVSDKWAPVSPLTGRLDAFEWKVPVEMLEGPTESVDYSEFAVAAPAEVSLVSDVEIRPAEIQQSEPDTAIATLPAKSDDAQLENGEDQGDTGRQPSATDKAAGDHAEEVGKAADTSNVKSDSPATQPSLPDDPGVVDPESEKPKTSRFRLF